MVSFIEAPLARATEIAEYGRAERASIECRETGGRYRIQIGASNVARAATASLQEQSYFGRGGGSEDGAGADELDGPTKESNVDAA